MLWKLCSSKQFSVQGHAACQFHHVCFMRIQMCTFKLYQINPHVHMGSFYENIHSPITTKQNDTQEK